MVDVDGHEGLFAIVDGAADDTVYRMVVNADCDYFCLYAGVLEPELAEVAPYLVQLTPDSQFMRWLIEEGWSHNWFVLLVSSVDLVALRRHFRKFLMVEDDLDRPMYFRYYDPRVMRTFLPTCNQNELDEFFGGFLDYIVESEDGTALIFYSLTAGNLKSELVPLL